MEEKELEVFKKQENMNITEITPILNEDYNTKKPITMLEGLILQNIVNPQSILSNVKV